METFDFLIVIAVTIGNICVVHAVILIYMGLHHPCKLVTMCDLAFTKREVSRFTGAFVDVSKIKRWFYAIFFGLSILGIWILLWGGFSFAFSWMPEHWRMGEDRTWAGHWIAGLFTIIAAMGVPMFLEEAIRAHAWRSHIIEESNKDAFDFLRKEDKAIERMTNDSKRPPHT